MRNQTGKIERQQQEFAAVDGASGMATERLMEDDDRKHGSYSNELSDSPRGERQREKSAVDGASTWRWIEMERAMEDRKGYLDALTLEVRFLRTFHQYAAPRCVEYQNLKHLLTRAQVFYRIRAPGGLKKLEALNNFTGLEMLTAFNDVAADMLDEVKLVNSEIRHVYRILSQSSHRPHHHLRMSNELVIKFVDSLLENMKYLFGIKVELVDTLKIKLEAIEGKLRFLTTLLMFMTKRCPEHEKLTDLFAHAKSVADSAAYLCHSCLAAGEMDEDLVRKIDPLTPLVRQIYNYGLLKAAAVSSSSSSSESSSGPNLNTPEEDKMAAEFVQCLLEEVNELLNGAAPAWTVPMRDQIKILHGELAFLRSFLMDPPSHQPHHSEALTSLLAQSKTISIKAGSVAYSFFDTEMNEETATKVCSSVLSLLEEIKLIRAEIIEALLGPLCPKFPNTDELGSFDRFLRNLRELLKNRTSLLTCLNLPIESLLEELQFLRSFLSKSAKRHIEQEKLNVLWTQIVDVACKAEYIVDSLLVGNGQIWCLMLWLSEVRMEIGVLKAEVCKIGDNKIRNSQVDHGEEISGHSSSQITSPELNEVLIGYGDVEEGIIEDLVRGSTKLHMVAIVGMPGQGKTHLAKKMYNHPTVKNYFYACAWCYVSQSYKRKSLLTQILSQVQGPTKRMFEMAGEEELAEALYKSLKGKRYFILMDDVWEADAWHALRRSFPDDNNGSRIMYTSRFHNLDLKAFGNKIHHLRPFSEDESWQLLQERIFQSRSCPSELLEVGKQIAKNCDGLPLAVVVVAGILARIEKKQQEWSIVANSLSSHIVGDPEKKCIKVIELSYKHLPDYLKPCFLYVGALVENKHIRVRKLICLWVAEGFVHKVEGKKSLEDIAEDYLIDLINSSLIIVERRRSTGHIKECRLHDLIRDFCLVKAREDNFLWLIEQLPTRDIICRQRRVGCNQPDSILLSTACGPHVRSLTFFHPGRPFEIRKYNVSSMCDKFKLVSVLNLGCIWVRDTTFPEGINSLTHLRYLSICGEFESIPASIANLWQLETFIVKGDPCDVQLPHTIWNMINLRHLEISESALLNLPRNGVSRLDNLQAVSALKLSDEGDTVELMEGLANVKYLKCYLDIWRDNHGSRNWLLGLTTLCQLQSLCLCLSKEWPSNYDFSLPSSLKKLTMSGNFRMPWNKMSVIGKLPNLEVLKLLHGAFKGEEWDMTDGEFPKLKCLKLENFYISKWSFSGDYFPPLKQLVLYHCFRLWEIPSCLGDIPTLNMIRVIQCNSGLEEVVKQIEEEQLDMGNQDLKVVIKRSDIWAERRNRRD